MVLHASGLYFKDGNQFETPLYKLTRVARSTTADTISKIFKNYLLTYKIHYEKKIIFFEVEPWHSLLWVSLMKKKVWLTLVFTILKAIIILPNSYYLLKYYIFFGVINCFHLEKLSHNFKIQILNSVLKQVLYTLCFTKWQKRALNLTKLNIMFDAWFSFVSLML